MTDLREPADISDDAILNGRLRLFQPRRGHRFGHDAILLAAAVPARPGERVAEFGAGVGAASLALLARVAALDATLYEIDAHLCALAQDNIARNGFADRARAAARDIETAPPDVRFDRIFMNPPFNDARYQPSPDSGRSRAHAATPDLLQRWIENAHAGLADGGTVTLIWRAEGLANVVQALEARFGAVSILPVYPAPGRAAIRLIANAEKNGRGRLRILPPLFLNDDALRPTREAEAIMRDGAPLIITET